MRLTVIFLIGILFLSSIGLLLYIDRGCLQKKILQQQKELAKLNIVIQEGEKRDSLYTEHLRNCSFILKNQLYINKNGYLKVKKSTNYIDSWK